MKAFTFDNPRITAIFALAAATVVSIFDFIVASLEANPALFADDVAADETARLLLTPAVGDFVSQTDDSSIWEFTGEDPTEAGDWTERAVNQFIPLQNFIKGLSGKLKIDSSIGNKGAGTLDIMSGFSQTEPTAADIQAFGIPVAVDTERTCSGHARQLFIYSDAGTDVLLDIVMEVG